MNSYFFPYALNITPKTNFYESKLKYFIHTSVSPSLMPVCFSRGSAGVREADSRVLLIAAQNTSTGID